jgi:hypothetical protein
MRRPCAALDQRRTMAAPLPAIEHRQLVEPGSAAAYRMPKGRDRHPQQAVTAPMLQRRKGRRRHGGHAAKPDTSVAQIGFVFDLRQ